MFLKQEPKYRAQGGHIVNRATGKPVPDDEPVMVFRAQDKFAIVALQAYAGVVEGDHRRVINMRVSDFERFAKEHPTRMKTPDTTVTFSGVNGQAAVAPEGVEVLVPGTQYQLSGGYQLQFVHKVRSGPDAFEIAPGTTNEELIEVLLHRIAFLDNQIPCIENADALAQLRLALLALEKRAARVAAERAPKAATPPVADITMKETPLSSNVHSYGYDPISKTLAVRFKTGANPYHYPGVPAETFAELEAAPSIGSFISKQIVPHYTAAKPPAAAA